MKNKIIPCYVLLMLTLTLSCMELQHTRNNCPDEIIPDKFLQPIVFTRSGVKFFLKEVFNDQRYINFLPFNFTHLVECLQEGKVNNKDLGYSESIIRMFSNKIKRSPYVASYAFSEMLDSFPRLFKDACLTSSEVSLLDQAKKVAKDILYSFFLSKFSFFKTNPDDFFNELSDELVGSLHVQKAFGNSIEKEEFRQTLIRFLDIGLIKLVWSPVDQELVWDSVKKIAEQLFALHEAKIINYDELDDLYKSLLESFCKFLNLAGSELSLEVVETMKADIASGKLLLFELEEQEDFLETKRERMTTVLIQTEAKIHGRLKGIITETVVFG